jgi:phosphate transport system permease protein
MWNSNRNFVEEGQKRKEVLIHGFLALMASVTILGLLILFIYIAREGIVLFSKVNLFEFLFGSVWKPTSGKFGALPLIAGSFIVTAGAVLISAPLSLFVAIFLTEIAPKKVAYYLKTAIELLAGIPSVVYGFIGIIVLVPLVKSIFGGSGFGILTGWIVLAIMILPTITSLSEGALAAVPDRYRYGALALGATKWEMISKVVLPAAKRGIVSAIILGVGRAIGETMAVLMVLGNVPKLPESFNQPVATMTSIIALDISYASGLHKYALFSLGFVLLLLSMGFIAIVRLVYKSDYGRS